MAPMIGTIPSGRTGRRLGVYEVRGPLGAGGMGEVYRARDTKLERDVAIKILPDALTGSAIGSRGSNVRRACSPRSTIPTSARSTASRKPTACTALVLELVEGETLAGRIEPGRGPRDRSAGHRAPDRRRAGCRAREGHRPSRPEAGEREAHARLDDQSRCSTLASRSSWQARPARRTVAGTDGDLRRHQRGSHPGHRGVHEPRAGARARRRQAHGHLGVRLRALRNADGAPGFAGATISDTIAAIIEREPSWDVLPGATPPRIRELLRRCLQKDPGKRLRDIGDARTEIDETLEPRSRSRRSGGSPLAAAAMAILLAVGLFWVLWTGRGVPTDPSQWEQITGFLIPRLSRRSPVTVACSPSSGGRGPSSLGDRCTSNSSLRENPFPSRATPSPR